nr:hypothetical protein [Pedobacter schmidteae]
MKGISITPEFRSVSASELQKFWRKSSTGMPKRVKKVRVCFILIPGKK